MFIWVAQLGWTKWHDLIIDNERFSILFAAADGEKLDTLRTICRWKRFLGFYLLWLNKIQMILWWLFLTNQQKLSIEQPGSFRYLKQSDFKDSALNEVQDESHIQSPPSCFAAQRCSRWVPLFSPGFVVLFYNLKQDVLEWRSE